MRSLKQRANPMGCENLSLAPPLPAVVHKHRDSNIVRAVCNSLAVHIDMSSCWDLNDSAVVRRVVSGKLARTLSHPGDLLT